MCGVALKWDKSAEGAIGQIKDKGYVDALKEYKGNLLLVGINYDIDVLGLILSLSIKSVCLVTPLYQIQGIFFFVFPSNSRFLPNSANIVTIFLICPPFVPSLVL